MALALDELVESRAGKIGSPIPRSRTPGSACSSTNSCQAGMIRAGLRADHVHVRELHALGVRPERLTKLLELVRERDDQSRLVRLEARSDERNAALDELVVAGVEECLVPETLVRQAFGLCCCRPHGPADPYPLRPITMRKERSHGE